jgi:hypothetical protein
MKWDALRRARSSAVEVLDIRFDEHPIRVRLRHRDYDGVVFDVWLGEHPSDVVGYAVRLTEEATHPLGSRTGLRAPYGEIVGEADRFVREDIGFHPVAEWLEPGSTSPLATRLASRPGRRSRALVDYAEIAKAYVGALDERNPVETAADQLGMSRKSLSNALTRARDKGLLTRDKQGRAGGQLTNKALELLKQKETEDGTR